MTVTRLDDRLRQLRRSGRVGLMTHVVLGYPSLAESISIIETMAAAGVDLIEVQIPFSDPVADGTTIMRASDVALRQGIGPDDVLAAVAGLSQRIATPLLIMGYYNLFFRYGVERFCTAARAAGAVGLIVPDVPLDEESDEHFIRSCEVHDLHHIRVVAPASTADRLRKNAALANGFVYCVSRYGTTGVQGDLDGRLTSYLGRVREHISIPLAVGFGIATADHVRALRGLAEIAVIGSAVIDQIAGLDAVAYLPRLRAYLGKMRDAGER